MKYVITICFLFGLVACGEPDAERQKVLNDLKEFQAKCQKNPQDIECKEAESRKGS